MNVHTLTAAILLVASPTLAHAAETELHDDGRVATRSRPMFEIGLTTEGHWLVQSSARVTSADGSHGAFAAHFAVSPLDMLDLYVGYRGLYEVSRGDRGYTMTTDGDAAVLGARVRFPLLSWLGVVGALDVEALHLEHELAVNNRAASTGEWTFGVVPRAGLELLLDLGSWAGLLRLEGGYAFRGAPAVSMTLASEAAEVEPVALGTIDLSGPVFALTLGIRF